MNIPLPHPPNTVGSRQPYNCKPFSSYKVSVETASLRARGTLTPRVMDLDIEVKRESDSKEVAVCIPSAPLEICALREDRSDLILRRWWENWRHNIAFSLGAYRNIGPLFFVLEKTDTEQFSNCYYAGQNNETKLRVQQL